MAIVIDQMEVQPAAAAPSAPAAQPTADAAPASEQQKDGEVERILASRHDRLTRLRAY